MADTKYVLLPQNSTEGIRTKIKKGDVLVSITADLGIIGYIDSHFPTPAYVSQHIALLRIRCQTIIGRYIAYFLAGPVAQKRFLQITDQGAKAGLNLNAIRIFNLAIPSLAEQEKITRILSTWDTAISQTRKLIDAKIHRKNALMQKLLQGKKRLTGFENPWNECCLGDLFVERRETNNDHLPLLAITGKRGIILASEIDRKDSSNADKSKYKRIAPGDIGYNTMRMWQGVSAVSGLEGIVSPAYTICQPKGNVNALFTGYLFKFPPVIHSFWRHSQGLVSDTWNLKFHHFAQIRVKIPDVREQKAIASFLTAVDNEIKSHESNLTTIEKQKRGLMQKLLTGEVRVNT